MRVAFEKHRSSLLTQCPLVQCLPDSLLKDKVGSSVLGPFFTAPSVPKFTQAEDNKRVLMLSGGVFVGRALAFLNDFDTEKQCAISLITFKAWQRSARCFPRGEAQDIHERLAPWRCLVVLMCCRPHCLVLERPHWEEAHAEVNAQSSPVWNVAKGVSAPRSQYVVQEQERGVLNCIVDVVGNWTVGQTCYSQRSYAQHHCATMETQPV